MNRNDYILREVEKLIKSNIIPSNVFYHIYYCMWNIHRVDRDNIPENTLHLNFSIILTLYGFGYGCTATKAQFNFVTMCKYFCSFYQ